MLTKPLVPASDRAKGLFFVVGVKPPTADGALVALASNIFRISTAWLLEAIVTVVAGSNSPTSWIFKSRHIEEIG